MSATALYTEIRTTGHGLTESQVIQRAQRLGYTMVRFAGWTDMDLGPSGMPGPRRAEAKANAVILREIQDACAVPQTGFEADVPHIVATVEQSE